jgi:hypothetical protein
MKTEDFIKVIRKLIKEEVKNVVADEVNKSMARLLAEVMNGQKQPAAAIVAESAPARSFVKNPKLNEAMNSVAYRDPQSGPRVSLQDMFDKIGTPEAVYDHPDAPVVMDTSSNINMLKSIVGGGSESAPQKQSVLDSAPPILGSVFKKDFRSLMRKIDEKKKPGNMSGMFAGSVSMMSHENNGEINE